MHLFHEYFKYARGEDLVQGGVFNIDVPVKSQAFAGQRHASRDGALHRAPAD